MLFALLYLVARRLFGLVGGSGSEDLSKDVEILVLRHQLEVLRRQAGRPRLRRLDRVVLAAASRVLPRSAWSSLMVSPQTLLRWHRELVRRKWTYRRKHCVGRPPLDAATCEGDPANRPREPAVGLRADPGRAGQARDPRFRDHDPYAPSPPWVGSCA